MLSQAALVVANADTSLNTEPVVLDALSAAAVDQHTTHDVVLMVELGDLREGVPADDVIDLARAVAKRPGQTGTAMGRNRPGRVR
jgi:predicted amino acid racemase